jgi:hypothetical protein
MSASVNPDIVTDGLVLCLDDKDLMPNGSWKDILLNQTLNGATYANSVWSNNIEALTVCIFMEKIGNSTSFASYLISKMNSGTSNASFRLYHFHNYLGNSPNMEGVMYWYGTKNTTWGPLAYPVSLSLNEKAFLCLQYNAVDGGIMWKNTTKASNGIRFGSGVLGVNGNGNIDSIPTPITGNGLSKGFYYAIYNRELQDIEVLQNYKALKGRYGL